MATLDWGVAGRDMARALWRRLRPWEHPGDDDALPGCGDIPVVLLPGILEPWTYLAPLGRWLARHGHRVEYVETLGWNLSDLEASAQHCLDVIRERGIRKAVLVAHSKGGLIGKAVLLRQAEPETAVGLVTVATPFAGSTVGGPLQKLGLLARSPLGMFFPDSPTIRDLARESEVNAHIVSLAPRWDQVIPDGSHLPGATNVTLDVAGHFRPVREESVWRVIHDHVHALAEAP